MSTRTRPSSPALSAPAKDFVSQLDTFTQDTPGVQHAVVVSADGQLLARAVGDGAPVLPAPHLAAAVSGIAGLAGGAAESYKLGDLNTVIVDATLGYLLVSRMSELSALGVAVGKTSAISTIAYGMTRFARSSEATLTQAVVSELSDWIRRTEPKPDRELVLAGPRPVRPGLARSLDDMH